MAVYGAGLYGVAIYGAGGIPVSAEFDIYDFCEPTDITMLSLFAFSEVSPSRVFGIPNIYFGASNDLILYSDDSVNSGFRVDINVTDSFTVQFSLMPIHLPSDFSDPNKRIFIAAYNRYGKMIGILLSENGGIALASTGTGSYQTLVDSADLFNESITDYWTFRITADHSTGRGNLYVTRQDLLPVIGHQLRYTFNLLDSPIGLTDHTLVEVVGTAADPVSIGLDCWRLASAVRMPNKRPIAVPGPDQTLILGGYSGFDGRDSYDPDGDNIVVHWWTTSNAPEGSDYVVTGTCVTAVDASSFTNNISGDPGAFSDVMVGDLVYVGDNGSVVKYVDDVQLVVVDHVFPANVSTSWRAIKQEGWGGARTLGSIVTVIDILAVPPMAPSNGDTYLVDAGAIGAWAGMDDTIATYDNFTASWSFSVPSQNDVVYVVADTFNRRYLAAAHPGGFWEIDDPLPWELDHWSGRLNQIGNFLPDQNGLHTMSLLVRDDGAVSGGPALNSVPSEVLLNVNETLVPFGVIPDMGWIWNYLPDIWDLVSDKDKITTVWSGFAQVAAGLLLELWQHDYGKALLDIQRVFQKRWLNYNTIYNEPNYDELPATVNWSSNLYGYSVAPGILPNTYETGIALGDVPSGYLLILNGVGYRIDRAAGTTIITKDALPIADRSVCWRIAPTVVSRDTNFDLERVSAEDVAVFEVDDGDNDPFFVETHVFGVKLNYLGFDYDPILSYLNDDSYSVKFTLVKRRSALRLNEYIVGIPRLQEVINRSAIEDSPDPLYENLNYFIDEENANDLSVNTLRFRDAFSPKIAGGYDGDTTVGPQYFDSAGSDFLDIFGVEAGTVVEEGYILELGTGRYRVLSVVSATRLEMHAESFAPDSGLEWTLRELFDPPEYLWAEITYIDNRPTIEANFGRLVGFNVEDLRTRADDLDYLSAVQGLWYTYWFGPKPYNIRVGSQILLGLPFAEQTGTIVDIHAPFDVTRSRVLVQDIKNPSIVRSYFFPSSLSIEVNPETDVPYVVGDVIQQFAPLSTGVEVVDYIEDDSWFASYLESGDFYEVWKLHTFGVMIDATAFNVDNAEFVLSYVLRFKPHYTYPFFVIRDSTYDIVTIDDATAFGPVVPGSSFELSDDWVYPTPLGWANSPWESRVNRTAYTYDVTSRWPVDRPTESPRYIEQGNLLLVDTPGRIPDGWSGPWPSGAPGVHDQTRAEGAHVLNDTDESGHYIHRLNAESFATDIAVDGDMELIGDVTNWPDIPASGPLLKQKTLHDGSLRLEVRDVSSFMGCYQDFSTASLADLETWQIAVRCKVYVIDGQAVFRIRDQDGVTYVAEARHAWVGPDTYQDVVLHVWVVSGNASSIRFEILTGPAGGHFLVDDVEMYEKAVPWDQWGLNRAIMGRTGGYTFGGSPDEYVTALITAPVP